MRHTLIATLVCAGLIGGSSIAASQTHAQTAKKKTTVTRKKPARPSTGDWQRGGIVGCSNGPVPTGRAGAFLRSMGGGRSCADNQVETPQPTQPKRALGWYLRTNEDNKASVDDIGGLGLTVSIVCLPDTNRPMLVIDPTLSLRDGANDSIRSRENQRLYDGLVFLLVTAEGYDGRLTRFELDRQDLMGLANFYKPISAADMSAFKSARLVTVTSAKWAAPFTGVDAEPVLGTLPC